MPTARPDAVLVPAMPAAMMLPTAIDIEWAVLPHTCAPNSVTSSFVRVDGFMSAQCRRPTGSGKRPFLPKTTEPMRACVKERHGFAGA